MISNTYDFSKFLEAMSRIEYLEMLSLAEQEYMDANARADDPKADPKARGSGSREYARQVGDFLYFIRRGKRPTDAPDQEFALYRPICEDLVKKKQFDPSILDLFKKA